MNACRYCEHSEARGGERLHCLRHNATVQWDDTCAEFSRAPGSDDDLGEEDEPVSDAR